MFRGFVFTSFLLIFSAGSAEPLHPGGEQPLTPAQALASLRVEPGLKVELAAAEPLVASPCAVAWDERGRMFVVENRGYPTGPGSNQPPAGVIALLESTKGDGVYDRRTVFADGLTFPNGILCWRGGVFVTCAPDIFYLKDTDGDGKADVKRVVLTGFNDKNTTQLRMSHPTLGPDGWVHLTSGLTGGKVTSPEHPERAAVEFNRSDSRFHPDTFEFETTAGAGQFGLAFDDFGRKFICSNRNPLQHVVLHPRDLRRNPFLAFSETVAEVSPFGDAAKVWPLSEDRTTAAFIPGLMSTPHAGTFTSACGISIYRGGALPAEFYGSAFICEPAQNLVQRQTLTRDGPTFTSRPATPGREFLAATDSWFRPVFSATGPDGALHICDMYRKVIDHPQYLPEHIRGSLDYDAGKSLGRIWRVRAERQKEEGKRTKFDLAKVSTKELVAKLNDANGWTRDTAFRLLLERRDKAAVSHLVQIVKQAEKQREQGAELAGAVAAMRLLDRQGAFFDAGVSYARSSVNPEVVGTCVQLVAAERAHLMLVEGLEEHSDPGVRFQAALALGEADIPRLSVALAKIALRDAANRWMRAAVLSSAGKRSDEFFAAVIQSPGKNGGIAPLMQDLAQMLAAAHPPEKLLEFLNATLASTKPEDAAWQIAAATGFANGARSRGLAKGNRPALLTLVDSDAPFAKTAAARLAGLFRRAAEIAASSTSPVPQRLAAIELLAHGESTQAGPVLQSLVAPQMPAEIQAMAVRALAQLPGADGAWLVERGRWRAFTPPVRDAVLTALLSQPRLQLVLLEAVEKGVVQPWAVPANRRSPLLKHKDDAVRARAEKAFQPQGAAERMRVYEEYKAVLQLPANGENGREVFLKTCAACHQYAGEGQRVGPELTGVRNQPAEALLLHIIVPDAEIYPGFISYEVETKDGRSLTGLLASDTPTSVTLRAAQGIEETILRADIMKISSASTSLMPNELEKGMSRQDLADLLGFLKGTKNLLAR